MGDANTTITQSMTFRTMKLGDYGGRVQRVYETAFGLGIGIYSPVAHEWLAKASVVSRASRRSVTVEFKATIWDRQAAYSADVKVQSMSALSFSNDVKLANVALSETCLLYTSPSPRDS